MLYRHHLDVYTVLYSLKLLKEALASILGHLIVKHSVHIYTISHFVAKYSKIPILQHHIKYGEFEAIFKQFLWCLQKRTIQSCNLYF